MAAYKDEQRNTWYVAFYYKNWKGENVKKKKRGFKTKKEALAWERSFKEEKEENIDMLFSEFVELYTEDRKPRLKYNTWLTKEHIIETKLLPYFGKKKMDDIKASDIVKWQNKMITMVDKNGEKLSDPYLRTIQSQLSAIFNHATRFYGLRTNPVRIAGSIGSKEGGEVTVWSREEYKKFSEAISDRPQSYFAFEVLYWTGMRMGELLALTPADIDTEACTISINKSLQNLKGEIVITSPKTPKSNRMIQIPQFLCNELVDYQELMYGLMPDHRLFQITKSYLHNEMRRGAKLANVPRIRIHDIRHSHVSMLISMGFSAVDIASRMGHENIDITMRYAHMFPSAQKKIASELEALNCN